MFPPHRSTKPLLCLIGLLLGVWGQTSLIAQSPPAAEAVHDTFYVDKGQGVIWVIRAEERGDHYNLYLNADGHDRGYNGCIYAHEYEALKANGQLDAYIESRYTFRSWSDVTTEPQASGQKESRRRRRSRRR